MAQSRRSFLKTGLLAAGVAITPNFLLQPAVAAAPSSSSPLFRTALFRNAMAAMQRHGSRFAFRDRIAIADFNQPSGRPRFHLVDLVNGTAESLYVSHGSGSDPRHTGWLQHFSNEDGSNASSEGTFVTSSYYVGKHGRSQRLIGLDPTNDKALSRAIVIHSAWYANPDMVRTRGQLGRSQGCFAVGETVLDQVFARLGQGRMLYSAKV